MLKTLAFHCREISQLQRLCFILPLANISRSVIELHADTFMYWKNNILTLVDTAEKYSPELVFRRTVKTLSVHMRCM